MNYEQIVGVMTQVCDVPNTWQNHKLTQNSSRENQCNNVSCQGVGQYISEQLVVQVPGGRGDPPYPESL